MCITNSYSIRDYTTGPNSMPLILTLYFSGPFIKCVKSRKVINVEFDLAVRSDHLKRIDS